MGLHAKDSGGTFELPPAGTHPARCWMVIDLGLQSTNYEGKEKLQHKVLIGWELPTELMDDGRPFVVSKRYTLSTDDRATLAQHLNSWRGRSFSDEERANFDVFKVLGAPAQVTVTHDTRDGKTYAGVSSVTKLMKGVAVPAAVNQPISFSFEDSDTPGEEIPEWIRNVIAKAKHKSWEHHDAENKKEEKHPNAPESEPDFDDDIPF